MNANRWQIHQYLAQQMDNRLLLLRTIPQRILLHGADGDASRALLAARYPHAILSEFDPYDDFLYEANDARTQTQSWFAKLTRTPNVPQYCLKIDAMLPENTADMLWSNLLLPRTHNVADMLRNWAQALQNDGLLFFSHLGNGSLPEIRALLDTENINYTDNLLIDMHDLGDMLLETGFYDPIVDTSQLVLTYHTSDALLRDMDTLGLWHTLRPCDLPAAQRHVQAACAHGKLSQLTLQIVLGHALKKTVLPENTHIIQFYPREH